MLLSILLWAPGLPEIIVIVLIIALLFGARRIPDMFKGIGQGIREFKKATDVDADTKDKEEESSKK